MTLRPLELSAPCHQMATAKISTEDLRTLLQPIPAHIDRILLAKVPFQEVLQGSNTTTMGSTTTKACRSTDHMGMEVMVAASQSFETYKLGGTHASRTHQLFPSKGTRALHRTFNRILFLTAVAAFWLQGIWQLRFTWDISHLHLLRSLSTVSFSHHPGPALQIFYVGFSIFVSGPLSFPICTWQKSAVIGHFLCTFELVFSGRTIVRHQGPDERCLDNPCIY